MYPDSQDVLRPPENPENFLDMAPELKDFWDFDFVSLMNKDSTNMNPDDWVKIAEAIYERRDAGYDGFVIAHGTDTMHFSASAVALALGANLNFPVVFTGAQTTPDVPHGDARVNLLRAFKVASTDLAEVVICFGNHVFRGCRAQKKDERRFDAFESPACFPLADITAEILIHPAAIMRRTTKEEIEFKSKFASGVFQVSLIPGLEPHLLLSLLDEDDCKGIVLQSFGAGNVPNEEPYSLTGFIEQATTAGKPVLVTSQFPANATLHTAYEPGRKAIEAGAVPTGNMTSACAMAKFRWVLAQVDEMDLTSSTEKLQKIREMMNTVYIEELDV
jgi:L-asparaginase